MIVSIIVIITTLIIAIRYYKSSNVNQKTSTWAITIGIILGGLIIAAIQPFKLERVDAGHVGIKVNLTGDNRGVSKFEYKTGWVLYNSWISRLYEFPVYQ